MKILIVSLLLMGAAFAQPAPSPGEISAHLSPAPPRHVNIHGWQVTYERADIEQQSTLTIVHFNIIAKHGDESATYQGGILYGKANLSTPQGTQLRPVYSQFVFQLTP